MTPFDASPTVADVVRGGFLEGVHRGSLIVLDPDGGVVVSLGTPDAPVLPRSSSKLMQATAMVEHGLTLPTELLALAAGSHGGEPMHVSGVRRILATAAIPESALQTPSDLPYDEKARHDVIAAGGGPTRQLHNCSGKHAAMLVTCSLNGWELSTYRSPDHPLQQAIARTLATMSGEAPGVPTVDGCGAPLFPLSLRGLASAFSGAIVADPTTPQRQVADAMRAYPFMVGSTLSDDSLLMAGVPGLLAKVGAEAVYAVAWGEGYTLAIKIDDGGDRARQVVAAAVLRAVGVVAPVVDEQVRVPLLGGGAPVGEVRPSEQLLDALANLH